MQLSNPFRRRAAFGALATLALAAACAPGASNSRATPAQAAAFMDSTEQELAELGIRASQAGWVAATHITDDTEALSAEAAKNYAVAVQRRAIEAKRFESLDLDPVLKRKFTLLKLGLSAPPPGNAAEAAELSKISASLEADYGKGQYCPGGPATCQDIGALSRTLATSRNPAELLDAWQGWHRVGAPMKDRYARFVELSNKGAKELGFADAGAMWRSNYDMPADSFALEVERLWKQVEPLYVSLHAYTRTRLNEKYGDAVVPKDGMIPRTCSATCGRRSGATSTTWWRRRARRGRATTSPSWSARSSSTPRRW